MFDFRVRCFYVVNRNQIIRTHQNNNHIFPLDRSFRSRDLLPPSCLEPDGRVVAPQLRDLLDRLQIVISDEEFDKLWLRYGGVDLDHETDPSVSFTLLKSTYK